MKKFIVILVYNLLIMGVVNILLSDDSVYSDDYFVVEISDMSLNGINDTLIVRSSIDRNPYAIFWGHCDTCVIAIDSTILVYPEWDSLQVNYSFIDINNDDESDLFFILSGKYNDGQNNIDTSRVIVIFSQTRIAEQDTLLIDIQTDSLFNPYYSMEYKSDFIIEPQNRNYSSNLSFSLPFINLDITNIPPPITPINISEKESNINIYPNPVKEEVLISFNNIPYGNYLVTIHSVDSKLVYEKTIPINSNLFNFTVDFTNFPNGTYFISSKCNEHIFSQKIIKLK